MAQVSKEELLAGLKELPGVDFEHEKTISFLENLSDTVDGLSGSNMRISELETELSNMKDKYVQRFLGYSGTDSMHSDTQVATVKADDSVVVSDEVEDLSIEELAEDYE